MLWHIQKTVISIIAAINSYIYANWTKKEVLKLKNWKSKFIHLDFPEVQKNDTTECH